MDHAFTLLDGGFTTVLEQKGYSLNNDPLWSARFLQTNPSLVMEVHKSYLASGCDIITTASYQATVQGFIRHLNITEEESKNLVKSSVYLAKQAREEYLSSEKSSREVLIAGSVGPYGAAQADGSEYSGNYCDELTCEELIEWHRSRVQCLVEAGVDLLAFETIPAVKEGEALMKLLGDFPGVKAWLSFSCQSSHQNSRGELLEDVASKCVKLAPPDQLIAIGVNCCSPQYVASLLGDISKATNVPLICYPNSGDTWDHKLGWISNKDKSISDFVPTWLEASAKFIGGCCRTGPEDIAAVAQMR